MSQTVIRRLSHEEQVPLSTDLSQAVGFTGLDAWMKFVHAFYGFPLYRLVAQTGDEITGWLALVRVKHPAFGDYLVTSPFGSYGGFAYSSVAARDGLLDQAQALAKQLGVEHVNVRFDAGGETPPAGWVGHPIYATYRVDLAPDPNTLLSAYSPTITSFAGCSISRPAASTYVTPVAAPPFVLIRSTWQPVRSVNRLSASSTGRIAVCGDALAKCSQPKRSQKPQNVQVLSSSPSGLTYGRLMFADGEGNGW